MDMPYAFKGGHDQTQFNMLSKDVKVEAFYHFLAEITILQRAQKNIVTFSSNIGQFVYMTCDYPEGVQSLDIQEFNIL
jgi:hypothetical protein